MFTEFNIEKNWLKIKKKRERFVRHLLPLFIGSSVKLNNAPPRYPGPNPCTVNVWPTRFVAEVHLEILN